MCLPCDLPLSPIGTHSAAVPRMCTKRHAKNVHSSTMCNGPKLDAIKMSVNSKVDFS